LAENVGDVDTVVVSTAIRESNPELVEARRRGLAVVHRAGALASVMVGRRAVAVAGTHGKTTTTSLLTVAIQHCGADPSFAIGGNLNESGANAHNGSGDVFVAEADESDGSFLLYSPTAAVVTNVEPDHLDHYGTPEAVAEAFDSFARRVQPGGFLVACADDEGAVRLATSARAAGVDVRTYGEAAHADLRLDHLTTRGLGSSFEPVLLGRRSARVELRLPGRHNALNAAAALLTGVGLGFPAERLREGLASFTGTRRRFEHKGTVNGVRVFDSYAHHPTELTADLTAAREVADGGRVVVVFQPHLFSRTQFFAADFGAALGLADEVVVMDVYAAREDPVPGVTGALVAAAVPLPAAQVVFEPSWSAVAGHLAERARPGDVVITCGAGDVTMIGPEVLARLEAGTPWP
jgi:UDP-N-acetylmuramate--alanine ligase